MKRGLGRNRFCYYRWLEWYLLYLFHFCQLRQLLSLFLALNKLSPYGKVTVQPHPIQLSAAEALHRSSHLNVTLQTS